MFSKEQTILPNLVLSDYSKGQCKDLLCTIKEYTICIYCNFLSVGKVNTCKPVLKFSAQAQVGRKLGKRDVDN